MPSDGNKDLAKLATLRILHAMKTRENAAAVVFGIEPVKDPQTGIWRFPDQVYGCLDLASELLADGAVQEIIVSGNRAVRQRYIEGDWHPQPECDMGADYLVLERGCPPDKVFREDISEDSAANYLYTVRNLVIPMEIDRLVAVTTPVREKRARFFGALVVSPYCAFDVVTTDYQATPAEAAKHETALNIHQYGFRDIEPGDLDALEARFYDGEPYPHFRYLDLANAHSEELVAV
jgi:hypothetical protein